MEVKKKSHLTAEERCIISALHRNEIGNNEIARQLNRDKGTISREINRNRGLRGYRTKQAQTKAIDRRSRVNKKKITVFGWCYIEYLLTVHKWSPEQIKGRLTHLGWEYVPSAGHIYRHIDINTKAGGTLRDNLRGRRKYRRRYASGLENRGKIPNRRDIEERDPVIETRTRLGDFEGDTVMGAKHQGAIVTLVDRKSRFLQASPLPNKSSLGVSLACVGLLRDKRTESITFDNGTEFSKHALISCATRADIFFAKPYSSWQRGTNENTNGLLRQYFPKKMPLNAVTDEQVQYAVNQLNQRPRKILGWQTPSEVWST
jgi:transposase, IS30 family